MTTTTTTTDAPWPRVYWRIEDLQALAEALLVMNPIGHPDAVSLTSYIRNLSERELYRQQRPIDFSTGGWTVCFYPAWEHLADRYDYVAIPTMTPYTAWRYVQEQQGGQS